MFVKPLVMSSLLVTSVFLAVFSTNSFVNCSNLSSNSYGCIENKVGSLAASNLTFSFFLFVVFYIKKD